MIVLDYTAILSYLLRLRGWRIIEDYIILGDEVYSTTAGIIGVLEEVWNMARKGELKADSIEGFFTSFLSALDKGLFIVEEPGPYLEKSLQISIELEVNPLSAIHIVQAQEKKAILLTSTGVAKKATVMGINAVGI